MHKTLCSIPGTTVAGKGVLQCDLPSSSLNFAVCSPLCRLMETVKTWVNHFLALTQTSYYLQNIHQISQQSETYFPPMLASKLMALSMLGRCSLSLSYTQPNTAIPINPILLPSSPAGRRDQATSAAVSFQPPSDAASAKR